MFSLAFPSGKFVPNFIRLLNLLFVLLIFLLIARWIDKFIAPHSSTFKLESLLQKFLSPSFSIFRSHLYRFSCKNSILNLFCSLFDNLLSFSVTEIKHSEGVTNNILFNFVIKTAVSSKTWRCIDF